MKSTLIRQARFLPCIYFGSIILASVFATDYSQIGRHASELALNDNKLAVKIFNIGMFLTGVSLLMFAAGLTMVFKKQFLITSTLVAVFGATYIVASFIAIGSRWHDIYGIGMSLMMLPFAFLSEVSREKLSHFTKAISVICAILIFIYLWSAINRFDPFEYRGLTQRIFGLTVFGFLSYIGFYVSALLDENNS